MVLCFGVATALAQSQWQLIMALMALGFGISGIFLAIDILCELLPKERAGNLSSALNLFFPFGSIFTNLCAYLFLDSHGWRMVCLCVALPVGTAFLLAMAYLPESPIWLLERNREDEAMKNIRSIAKLNGAKLSYSGLRLDEELSQVDENTLWKQHFGSLLILMPLWLCMAATYACLFLLGPKVLTRTVANLEADAPRKEIDYVSIGLAGVGEMFSVVFCMLLVDRLGRRRYQACFYVAAGLAAFSACQSLPYPMLAASVIAARCLFFAASCGTWLHTAEVFPVQIRGTSHAACNIMANVGRLLAPLAVGPYISNSTCGCMMCVALWTAAFLALLLPETRATAFFDPSHYGALRGASCRKEV